MNDKHPNRNLFLAIALSALCCSAGSISSPSRNEGGTGAPGLAGAKRT